MPAFVTHSLFGETVLDKLARKDIKNQILLYPSAFEWGLQGPDPLFFSIKDREKLVHAAETMHKSGTKELFFSIKHLITASENKKKEIGLSYFLGFLCHYYLDMNAHPFVYYFENKQQKEMLPSLRPFIHHRIESDIDSALYNLKKHQSVKDFNVIENFPVDKNLLNIPAEFLSLLFEKVYSLDISQNECLRAFSLARLAYLIFQDKRNIFSNLSRLLENTLFKNRVETSAYLRREYIPYDVLNLKREMWHSLNRPYEKTNSDFVSLFDRGASSCALLLTEFFDYILYNAPLLFSFQDSFSNGSLIK